MCITFFLILGNCITGGQTNIGTTFDKLSQLITLTKTSALMPKFWYIADENYDEEINTNISMIYMLYKLLSSWLGTTFAKLSKLITFTKTNALMPIDILRIKMMMRKLLSTSQWYMLVSSWELLLTSYHSW